MGMNIVFILLFFLIPNQVMAVKRISHDELYLGNDTNVDKTLRFNQRGLGTDPFIRYDSDAEKFTFASDSRAFQNQTATFVDAGNLRPLIRTAMCSQSGSHTCVAGNAGAWWSSVTSPNTPDGRTKITFDSDVFDGSDSEYSCYTTALNSSNGITCRVHGVSTSEVDIQCFDAGAHPTNNEDSNFFILCLFHST